jgi:hypothetical protein
MYFRALLCRKLRLLEPLFFNRLSLSAAPPAGACFALRFPTRPNSKVELRLLADDGKNHYAVLKDSVRVSLFQTVQPRRYFRLRESRPLDR